jgi:hypothetical protein
LLNSISVRRFSGVERSCAVRRRSAVVRRGVLVEARRRDLAHPLGQHVDRQERRHRRRVDVERDAPLVEEVEDAGQVQRVVHLKHDAAE